LTGLLIEAFCIFAILAATLIIEFNSRNLFTLEIIKEILSRSFAIALIYIIIFRIAKSGYYFFSGLLSSIFFKKEYKPLTFVDYLTDIFITLSFILTTVPVRPILQKVYLEQGKPIFNQALVRFDTLPAVIILSCVGLPLIVINFIKYKENVKYFYAFAIVSVIIIVGILNNRLNYQARIYESRADWIKRDWRGQADDAQKALESAKTDMDKAVAYYWLGVSSGRQGNCNEDIIYQLKAIELAPDYASPYSSLSLCNLELGNLDKAKTYAEKCIKLDPYYAWCYYALSGYYDYANQRVDSYKYLKKAIELDPKAVDFQNTLLEFKKNNPSIVE
jgi:tetratricopeptide (TPR) repeat protein